MRIPLSGARLRYGQCQDLAYRDKYSSVDDMWSYRKLAAAVSSSGVQATNGSPQPQICID